MSVAQLRALGLSMGMGSVYAPFTSETDGVTITTRRYRSWTTDEATANEARELGATVEHYRSTDPRFTGWEISVNEVES